MNSPGGRDTGGEQDERRERAYGAAGRAAGEAVLEFGRDGARLRPASDAFLLSRIARACVDAALAEFDAERPASLLTAERERANRLERLVSEAIKRGNLTTPWLERARAALRGEG